MQSKPLIISHRGDLTNAVENTIQSALDAINLGATGIEIDIRECASGEIVVFHDFALTRMYNRQGYIGRTQFSDLTQMPYLKDGKETEYTIDTLDAFLDRIKDKVPINLDAKTIHFFDFKFADKILSTIRNHNLINTVWVSCFNPFLLQILKIKDKKIKTGYLFETFAPIHTLYDNTVYSDAWHPYIKLIDRAFINKTKRKHKQVYVWTVNDESTIKNILRFPIDGIITDNISLLKRLIEENK